MGPMLTGDGVIQFVDGDGRAEATAQAIKTYRLSIRNIHTQSTLLALRLPMRFQVPASFSDPAGQTKPTDAIRFSTEDWTLLQTSSQATKNSLQKTYQLCFPVRPK